MPIKPENKHRYPRDWKAIRARILERAQERCETCGVPNYAIGERDAAGIFHELPGMQAEVAALDGVKTVQIVLTIAHISEVVEDCSDGNLIAECQRCHNRRDAPMRARHSRETRHQRKAVAELPLEVTP